MEEESNKLIVFESKEIRRVWHEDKWWFAVADIVEILSETKDVRQYIKRIRSRDKALNDKWGTICTPLAMIAKDGRKRKVNAASLEGIFRIIQSIPSPKAEPFKQWLAKVGFERIEEIENPEIAVKRSRQYWKDLGYTDEWITKRLQSVEIRGKLTDEWKARNVQEGKEYSILTAEIFKAAFGLKPSEHKQLKDLKRENLRDHMSDLELIFTMLAETTTRNKAVEQDAIGFEENKKAAIEGGSATGKAIDTYEKETGSKVVTNKNFKHQIAEAKKQKRLAAKEQKRLEKEKDKKD